MELQRLAISKLANSMRIFGEATLRFNSLKSIDAEEAVNNLDRAFEAKLEAFHSLYDVDKNDFDYFANADTAILILLRNAIHHRDHELFKSWNCEVELDDGRSRWAGAEFIFAAHEVVNAPIVMKQYYKLEDFLLRIDPELKSPFLEDRMGAKRSQQLLKLVKAELGFGEIIQHSIEGRYPLKQVYLNMLPIFISAICRTFGSLKNRGASFSGFDAAAYERPFTEELRVDLSSISYRTARIL